MKKLFYFTTIIFFTVTIISQAVSKDTLHVITHNKMTVVTNPAKGNNPYKAWGVFPDRNFQVRKIILHLTLGCPANLRVADWDYLDKISIRRIGGVNGKTKDFEIARMLTPYGGTFSKEWKFEWETDITDFVMLLRDSVEIEYNHSGYEPNNDRGWAVTLDFEFIKGTPVLEPISITKIYDGEFAYGDSLNSIENNLSPVPLKADKNAYVSRLRISQTGHGMHEDDGCGEFCSKKRYLYFDGELKNTKSMWIKCGDNPLYPQAGTWIYDRANWCPGYLELPDIYDLRVTPGKEHILDVNMEPYSHKKSTAVESICAYVIQYKKPHNRIDAAVVDVVIPSNKQLHSRKNPATFNPKIIIRNNGSEELNELTFKYGTTGFPSRDYKWKGNLSFNAAAEIELPSLIEAKPGINKFNVTLLKPNGRNDEYNSDNTFTAEFVNAPSHSNELILFLQTNSQPQQNEYFIKNSAGQILYKREFKSLKANTIYRDTLKLTAGAYDLVVKDSAGDGLEFWYNSAGGRGRVFLLDKKGELLKSFESDFGNSVYYSFYVADDAVNTGSKIPVVGVFPTRTLGKTTLDYFFGISKDITVQIITEDNKVIEEHKYADIKEGIFTYDLSYRPPQRYYLKLFINNELIFNKRIRVVDKL